MKMMKLKNTHARKQYRRQAGFTMLEVVVAMAVGAVGVMAFIGLQLKAVEISEDTRKRANAAYIAEEMAERMMANSQDYAAKRRYRKEDSSVYWDYPVSHSGYFNMANYCSYGTPPICQDSAAATAAFYDIVEVKVLAMHMLPNGNVGYRQCGTDNAFDCIVVTWGEANPATCDPKVMDGSGVDDCYILQVKVW